MDIQRDESLQRLRDGGVAVVNRSESRSLGPSEPASAPFIAPVTCKTCRATQMPGAVNTCPHRMARPSLLKPPPSSDWLPDAGCHLADHLGMKDAVRRRVQTAISALTETIRPSTYSR